MIFVTPITGKNAKTIRQIAKQMNKITKYGAPEFVRGVMYGLGNTGRKIMQEVAKDNFILRNKYTTGHMIYHVPRVYLIENMFVAVGHVKPYLKYHERGGSVPTKRRVTFVPKPGARVARDHTRLVRPVFWRENVKFSKEGDVTHHLGRKFIRLGDTVSEIPKGAKNDRKLNLLYVLAGKYVDVPPTWWISKSLYGVLSPHNFSNVVWDSIFRLKNRYNIRVKK